MSNAIKDWFGAEKESRFVRDFVNDSNIRAAIYSSGIVILLEIWMIFSLVSSIIERAAAGKPRDFIWIVQHGSWYVILLVTAIAVFIHTIKVFRGTSHKKHLSKPLLVVYCVFCIIFGIHFGNNSYQQGEQVLAFTTMTLFVFGLIVWRPLTSLIGTAVTFAGFYFLIDSGTPASFSVQVNLFTLWVSTLVVAYTIYRQRVSEAKIAEEILKANERLRRAVIFDDLTEIPNMNTFRISTEAILENAVERNDHYMILYMDIENFRNYNEKYGFDAGDKLLHQFANGLARVFDNEIVARLSDDHFVALCPTDVCEERIEASRELVHGLRRGARLRLKFGAYELENGKDLSVSRACDKARYACYSVKRRADCYYAVYDSDLDVTLQRRQYIINSVKTAVRMGWIKVYYQPVVRCSDGTGKLCGYEALARWDDPTYGLLPPFAFIDTLEEYREIDRLDRCIVEQVCRDLRAELDKGNPVVPVSLNFSRLDFELYDVPAFLTETAKRYGVPSNLLDVEITESALSQQMAKLQENMERLRDEHFSQWLDDFGSGYSSLNTLKDFHFDVLKVDMAFLRGFPENEKSGPILKAIIDLAKELDLVTLCEGVETREQFDFLHEIGCDRVQGYYFGKPASTKELPRAL